LRLWQRLNSFILLNAITKYCIGRTKKLFFNAPVMYIMTQILWIILQNITPYSNSCELFKSFLLLTFIHIFIFIEINFYRNWAKLS